MSEFNLKNKGRGKSISSPPRFDCETPCHVPCSRGAWDMITMATRLSLDAGLARIMPDALDDDDVNQ